MMRIRLLVFFMSLGIFSQAQQFSDSLRISLLTGSSGNDLYELFGHSAVRVQDFKFKKDVLFNYGTFDFDTPNFYGKFLQGKLNYVLGVGDTKRLAAYYDKVGRSLTEQEILLDKAQKTKIANFLLTNYQPENRSYLYDFFYDNCATRIRDIFETELDTKYVGDTTATRSFRDLLDIYLIKQPWTDFGIDLILGMPADKMASIRDEMFLPELMAANLKTHLKYKSGEELLGGSSLFNNTPPPILKKSTALFTPTNIFSLLFLFAIFLTFFASKTFLKGFDYLFFTLLGIAGCLILFMWFGTDHKATQLNLNAAWLNPLYLVLPFVLFRIDSDLRKQLLWGLLGISILVLALWNVLPQKFPYAGIPIVLTAILRCAAHLDLVDFKKRFEEMKPE